MADIANSVRLSPTHFTRAFKNSVGTTPYQWYQRERITRSMQLLCEKGKSLAEVASDCGFTDQSHFISSFSRIVGVTPGKWRRRARVEAG